MLDPDNFHYHGATHKSNNTGEVAAIGEALEWIHQQPPYFAIRYEICSDSYYGIDAVAVMPRRDSSRISAAGDSSSGSTSSCSNQRSGEHRTVQKSKSKSD